MSSLAILGGLAMPRAAPLAIRQEIDRRHRDGQTLARIADELRLPMDTVRDLWRIARDRGDEGLEARYRECGRSSGGVEMHVGFDPASRPWVASDLKGQELRRFEAPELNRADLGAGRREDARHRTKVGGRG